MIANSTSPEDIARQARERLEADANVRIDAVRRVAEAAREVEDRDQAARAAAAAHAAAWTAAVGAGWADKDLRQMGLRPPTNTPPAGGRRRARPTADPSPGDVSGTSNEE